jgi:AbrB family looped-hinge helix DNA binding protein
MNASTRLTSKGQVVIPKAVRQRLRWRAGTRLRVVVSEAGSVQLSPMRELEQAEADPIEMGFGFLTSGDPLAELEAEHRAEIDVDERRTRRP